MYATKKSECLKVCTGYDNVVGELRKVYVKVNIFVCKFSFE